MTTYTWIAPAAGAYGTPGNWSPTGTPTAAGDTALIGPGAQVDLAGTLTGVTVQLTAETSTGGTGATPQLALAGATLDNTLIETTDSSTFAGANNADLVMNGVVTNAGAIMETPAGGYGGDLNFALAAGAVFVNDGTIGGNAFSTLAIGGPGSAGFVNNGVVSGLGTAMTIAEPVSGAGQIELLRGSNPGSNTGSQSTLEATGAVGAGQTITMQNALLRLDQPLAFQGTIDATGAPPATSGLPANTIELPGVSATSEQVSDNTLYIYGGASLLAHIALDPGAANDSFVLNVGSFANGGGSGTSVSILPPQGSTGSDASAVASAAPDPAPAQTAAEMQPASGNSAGLTVLDTTTNQQLAAAPIPFSVPAAGLNDAYVNLTSDNLAITATTPGWFIYTGGGNDMISVSSGNNVLDGGGGSNFLSGGTGTDVFFVNDDHPNQTVWSTLNNFHPGDSAVILGVSPADFALNWANGQGSPGYTGLTAHATAPGQPAASLTLAGYTTSDLQNGRLAVAYGTNPTTGGGYMLIHAA